MITIVAVAIVALVFVVACEVEEQLCSRIRGDHPDVWRELGEPNRHFGDFGLEKRAAISQLFREPTLLNRCSAEVVRQIRICRFFGRAATAVSLITLVVCCVYCLTTL